MKSLVLALAMASSGIAWSARSADAPDRLQSAMTDAKVATDLGHVDEAVAGFRAIANDPAATSDMQVDALLRLGSVLRGAGRHEESVAAFTQVSKERGQDEEALRKLVVAVIGVEPSRSYWDRAWQRVQFLPAEEDGHAVLRVAFPEPMQASPAAPATTAASFSGEPISISLKDGDLLDIFRLFHEVSGLNIVVDPAIKGKTVTLELSDVPWDQALDLVLRTQGLASAVEGNVLRIAPPEKIASEGARGRALPPDEIIQAVEQQVTDANVRSLALCLLAYRKDHGSLPPAPEALDLDLIAPLLEPMYVAKLPREDGRGRRIQYRLLGREAPLGGKLVARSPEEVIELRFVGPDGRFDTKLGTADYFARAAPARGAR